MKTHLLAAAAAAGTLLLAPIAPAKAQERPCRASMSHLMEEGVCKQRMGCLGTHLQLLSKFGHTRLSAQTKKRLTHVKHPKGARAA